MRICFFRAFSAAKGEDALSLYGEDLAPHQVQDVLPDPVNLAAVPFLHRILFQQVKIFVGAVHK